MGTTSEVHLIICTEYTLCNSDAKQSRSTYVEADGKHRTWEWAKRLSRPKNSEIDGVDIVAILAKSEGPEILLQKQFRPPVNKVCVELPAGLIDEGETVEACAIRELREETGYVGEVVKGSRLSIPPIIYLDPGLSRHCIRWKVLLMVSGFSNSNLNMVHMSVDLSDSRNQHPKPELDEDEFIECFSVPLKDLCSECIRLERRGFAIDAMVGTLADGIELAKLWKLV